MNDARQLSEDYHWDETVGYIAICEDFHGYAGPFNEKDAVAAAIDLNLDALASAFSKGRKPCIYRVVADPSRVSMEKASFVYEQGKKTYADA